MYSPDFISLEIAEGFVVLIVNFGSGTIRVNNSVIDVTDGQPHGIEILFTKSTVELFVDDCRTSSCMALGAPIGLSEQLNGKFSLKRHKFNKPIKQISY